MKLPLLELICCPACQNRLEIAHSQEERGEIWHGRLLCVACGREYPIQNGMPHLYVADENWAPRAREAEGWVIIHQEMGIYEQIEDAIDLRIPYDGDGPWPKVARSFDHALAQLHLRGDEVVLDLGAGRGWAAKQFALRGCQVVALDVVPDEQVGLGRGKALMDYAGTYFERIIGDGQQLPLLPERFDIVFCAAALHHAADLGAFMVNIGKVLKKGGRLCAINEPCVPIWEDEQAVLARDAQDEMRLGINETRPNIDQYVAALRRGGLQPTALTPANCFGSPAWEVQAMAQDVGAALGPMAWSQPQRAFWRVYNWGKHRLRAAKRRVTAAPAPFAQPRPRHEYALLQWQFNELFLLAEKRP